VTRTAYDLEGELTSRTDAIGIGFTYTKSNRGWLLTVTDSVDCVEMGMASPSPTGKWAGE
jgi:hypothetical protein